MSTENEMREAGVERENVLLDLLRDYEDKPESLYGILDRAFAAGRRAGAEALMTRIVRILRNRQNWEPANVIAAVRCALPLEEEHD